ncbi:DUF6093 family protein [Nocardioides sp.]|uniref:DUF6093 family protein n=1 Tax=Nocardioides sp. TaxID=35761 RepID=UPI003511E2BA
MSAALARGRAAALARMTSRATIHRPGGFAEVEGFKVKAWAIVATDVPVRLRSRGASSASSIGTVSTEVARSEAHLPIGTDLRDGDLLEVTAGEHVGRVVRVVDSETGDQATALRVRVETVPRPQEWPA